MFFVSITFLSYLIPQHTLCFYNFQSLVLVYSSFEARSHSVSPLPQTHSLAWSGLTLKAALPPWYRECYGHTSHHAQVLTTLSLLILLSSWCFLLYFTVPNILAICISTVLSVAVIYFDVTFFLNMLSIWKILTEAHYCASWPFAFRGESSGTFRLASVALHLHFDYST